MPADLFATKGAEYLLVVAYFILLLALVRYLAPRAKPAPAPRPEPAAPPWFALADGYHFHPGHAWASADDGDLVTIGLDDFTAQLAGTPEHIDLPRVGTQLRQGGPGWTLRLGDRELPMLSPVDGQVVVANPAVAQDPRVAAEDPYGRGWLLKVRAPKQGAGAMRTLLSGELASHWMRQTAERLRWMAGADVGVVMTDGGSPMRGFGRSFGPEEWSVAAHDFFLAD